jgi:ketosteroid isomerase-like protein
MDVDTGLRDLYAAFNARDPDTLLGAMTDDVDWPNAWEGGRVHGRDAVRDYWTRQWAQIDPQLELLTITERPDGRFAVSVRQVVRSRSGELLSDSEVVHVYELRDGLIAGMTVEGPTGSE